MKSTFIFYSLFFYNISSFSIGSLGELSNQALFQKEGWPKVKNQVNETLKTNGPGLKESFRFNGSKLKKLDLTCMYLNDIEFKDCTIKKCDFHNASVLNTKFIKVKLKEVDFSKMDLQNIEFIKCKFIDCNLEETNLTNVKFTNCTSDNIKLHNASLGANVFFDKTELHEDLIRKYSRWMTQYKQEIGSSYADDFYAKTQALNKVLGLLKINLDKKNLGELNLAQINLSKASFCQCNFSKTNFTAANIKNTNFTESELNNANITDAILKNNDLSNAFLNGMVLSQTAKIVDHNNSISSTDITEDKTKYFNMLFHNHVLLDDDLMKEIVENNKDLSNGFLVNIDVKDYSNCNLKNCYFSENITSANFTNADLREASFEENDLTGAILTGAKLEGKRTFRDANLQEAWLSATVQVPDYDEEDRTVLFKKWAFGTDEERPLYQQYMNLGFDIFTGVSFEELNKVCWKEKDLSNANLMEAKLANLNLSEIKLKNADLYAANLQGTILQNANLKNAFMRSADLRKADLRGAKLKGAELKKARLSEYYFLPEECDDNTLIKCYNECKDQEAKWTLTQILVARKLLPKSLIKTEEPVEPPNKRIKTK